MKEIINMKNKVLLLTLVSTCLLVACNNSKGKKEGSKGDEPFIDNLSAEIGSYYTEAQLNYLNNDDPSNTTPYNGNMSVGAPNPVVLSWEGLSKDCVLTIYNEDMEVEEAFGLDGNSYELYNLEFDKTYYWNVASEDEKIISETMSFVIPRTVNGPRNLKIDGVENVRDIGGWSHKDNEGKLVPYMKQGMLYRSGRFNEDKATSVTPSITEDGIYELAYHLGIKTEVDLRRTGTNEVGSLTDQSVLGETVNYVQLPMIYEGQNILTYIGTAPRGSDTYSYNNPGAIKSFFELLADVNNYPINFHCSIGKDRTGCLAYLVEALMGFDEETIYRDYMFTNFANAGMCKLQDDVLNRYGATLNEYHGDNLQEKTYNYLHEEIGLTEEILNSVISILGV